MHGGDAQCEDDGHRHREADLHDEGRRRGQAGVAPFEHVGAGRHLVDVA